MQYEGGCVPVGLSRGKINWHKPHEQGNKQDSNRSQNPMGRLRSFYWHGKMLGGIMLGLNQGVTRDVSSVPQFNFVSARTSTRKTSLWSIVSVTQVNLLESKVMLWKYPTFQNGLAGSFSWAFLLVLGPKQPRTRWCGPGAWETHPAFWESTDTTQRLAMKNCDNHIDIEIHIYYAE